MQRFSATLPGFVALLVLAAVGLGSAAGPAGGPQTHVVRIENMRFTPNMITVRPGDTVEFRNTDLVPHTVTERSARAFDSGMINAKENWKLVVAEEGTLRYRCIYHPDMMGTIIVTTAADARGAAAVELCGAP